MHFLSKFRIHEKFTISDLVIRNEIPFQDKDIEHKLKNLLVKDSNFDLDETTKMKNVLAQLPSQSLIQSSQSFCDEHRYNLDLIPLL